MAPRIYHGSLPIPYSPSTSPALSFNPCPLRCIIIHPRRSLTTARATMTLVHCLVSAHPFSSVWSLLLIPQARLRCHPYQEALLHHLLVPIGRAPPRTSPRIQVTHSSSELPGPVLGAGSQHNTQSARLLGTYIPHHVVPGMIRDHIPGFISST